MSSLVAVADPDPATRTALARALAPHFAVVEAGDGMHALRQVFSMQPAAIVTEFSLPLLGGLELVRVLRGASDMSIVVVTANPAPQMAARALDAGADDYIAKPVFMPELLARVRATMRRSDRRVDILPVEGQTVRTGPLAIERGAHLVTLRGTTVPMTRTEHLLLDAMAGRLGQLCPHRYLLSAVWGSEYIDDTHYLRGYVASLRTKIEDNPAEPRLLLTEWGNGYRLAALPPEVQVDVEVDERLAVASFSA